MERPYARIGRLQAALCRIDAAYVVSSTREMENIFVPGVLHQHDGESASINAVKLAVGETHSCAPWRTCLARGIVCASRLGKGAE